MKGTMLWACGGCLLAGLLWLGTGNNLTAQGKKGGKPGEINTPPAKGERIKDAVRVGDAAPDFSLPDLKGKNEVKLSGFQGKKPVVIIFGSYT